MTEPVETWQNVSAGTVVVRKFDRLGQLVHESVGTQQKFTLTSQERLLNMDQAASDSLDVFKNGFLTPVRLLDDAEDYKEISSNPNLLSETELREMFGLHWKTFDAKLKTITNVFALERLEALADDDDVNVTVKQLSAIQDRLNEISPNSRVGQGQATVEQIGHIRSDEREHSLGVTPF